MVEYVDGIQIHDMFRFEFVFWCVNVHTHKHTLTHRRPNHTSIPVLYVVCIIFKQHFSFKNENSSLGFVYVSSFNEKQSRHVFFKIIWYTQSASYYSSPSDDLSNYDLTITRIQYFVCIELNVNLRMIITDSMSIYKKRGLKFEITFDLQLPFLSSNNPNTNLLIKITHNFYQVYVVWI